MSTLESDVEFFEQLQQHIASKHRALRCTVPSSGTYLARGVVAPSPDLIVENPSTGHALAIELKGGGEAASIPFATVPMMKVMKTALDSAGTRLMLVTVGKVPEPILEGLRRENIEVSQASSYSEALDQIDRSLQALEAAGR